MDQRFSITLFTPKVELEKEIEMRPIDAVTKANVDEHMIPVQSAMEWLEVRNAKQSFKMDKPCVALSLVVCTNLLGAVL